MRISQSTHVSIVLYICFPTTNSVQLFEIGLSNVLLWPSPVTQGVKNLPALQEFVLNPLPICVVFFFFFFSHFKWFPLMCKSLIKSHLLNFIFSQQMEQKIYSCYLGQGVFALCFALKIQ